MVYDDFSIGELNTRNASIKWTISVLEVNQGHSL